MIGLDEKIIPNKEAIKKFKEIFNVIVERCVDCFLTDRYAYVAIATIPLSVTEATQRLVKGEITFHEHFKLRLRSNKKFTHIKVGNTCFRKEFVINVLKVLGKEVQIALTCEDNILVIFNENGICLIAPDLTANPDNAVSIYDLAYKENETQTLLGKSYEIKKLMIIQKLASELGIEI